MSGRLGDGEFWNVELGFRIAECRKKKIKSTGKGQTGEKGDRVIGRMKSCDLRLPIKGCVTVTFGFRDGISGI